MPLTSLEDMILLAEIPKSPRRAVPARNAYGLMSFLTVPEPGAQLEFEFMSAVSHPGDLLDLSE